MDEMKQRNEIDKALREVAKLRDARLRTAPVLSSERRAALALDLAVKFPLEVALREAATRRDRSLSSDPPRIPGPVELALRRQLLAADAAGEGARERPAADWRISHSIWSRIFRSPLGAGLAACAIITAALVCVGRWGTPPRHRAAETLSQAAAVGLESAFTSHLALSSRTELFSRRIAVGPFNLNTSEPASLEAFFVSNRRLQFADWIETPLGLRLDLPLRATLIDEGLTSTP